MIACLGERFRCDRVVIFSVRNDRWIDTDFEWHSSTFVSLRDQLRRESLENYIWKEDFYSEGNIVLLRDVEEIRTSHPAVYALMKSRQVGSILSLFIPLDNAISALLCMENMDLSEAPLAKIVLERLNHHLTSLLKRRNMLQQLEEMSFHDQLTGAYNRNALNSLYQRPLPMKSIGVIFCDMTGLKQVNDTLGHEAGDEMIVQCCRLIQRSIHTDRIYRMGGDEFLALCFDMDKDALVRDVNELKAKIAKSEHHIAVGYVWFDEAPLIAAADKEMYLNKQQYYSTRDYFKRMATQSTDARPYLDENTAFQRYVKNNYFDAEAFLNSMTIHNTNQFIFFGDVQKNLFYVSDTMRDRFGFNSNLVVNLPHHWEQCICDEEYKRINSQAFGQMFTEKWNSYEILNLVKDVHGNRLLVHNSGTLQWNADKTVPLFLCGLITLQEKDYTIDQLSGFRKDYKALVDLGNRDNSGQDTAVIGFCLNHFSIINRDDPTYRGNMLLYHIGNHLRTDLSSQMTFYRLDGDYFMAILNPEFTDCQYDMMEKIRGIIEEEYQAIGIYDHNPDSFALLRYTEKPGATLDFLEMIYERIDTAKNLPNLPYVTASEEQQKQIDQAERMVTALRKNVENNMENFRIVIQLAVTADTKEVAGGEALLRWRYEGKDVLPHEILPLLEKEGLMDRVDRWVVEQVFRARVKLRGFAKECILSFNISYYALQSKGFTEFIKELMTRYEVDEYTFFAELNESYMLSHGEDINYFSSFCKQQGISIMQKKFSTRENLFKAGMSRDTDVVKLDCSLLNSLETEEEKHSYLESLIFLCHKFGKRLGICDIEDEESYRLVADCGCDYLQGFYIYRPLELVELYALLLS